MEKNRGLTSKDDYALVKKPENQDPPDFTKPLDSQTRHHRETAIQNTPPERKAILRKFLYSITGENNDL